MFSSPRLALFFALYFCQGLPGGFLANVLPVILRERGLSLTTIGFASLLSVPWVAKILWAPWVDRYGSSRFGRRRSWIVPAQLGMLLTTLALAFVEPESNLVLVAALFLLLNTFAATQDVAVDGLAVDSMPRRELGPANAAQVSGFKLGNLIGGGVLLALLPVLGWRGDFFVMTALLLGTVTLVLLTREPALPPDERPKTVREVVAALLSAVREGGWGLWLFLLYAKFAESLGGSQQKPMLVDHSVTKAQIGVLDGIIGAVATVLGALLGGLLVRRLGWARGLACCTALQGLMLVFIGLHQARGFDLWTFAALNAVEAFAGGGVAVAVFALAMQRSARATGATQFTAAQVIYMSGSFLAAPAGGLLGDTAGYEVVFCASGALALALAPVAWRVGRRW